MATSISANNLNYINSLTSSSSNKISGLISGMDTETLIKNMLAAQQARIDKVVQQKTLATWKQDAYRSAITKMTDFQSKYLNIQSSDSIVRYANLKNYSVSVSGDGSKYLSASATSSASMSGPLTVNSITSLASAQTLTSGAGAVTAAPVNLNFDINSTLLSDYSYVKTNLVGKGFTLTLDGVTKTIALPSEDDLAAQGFIITDGAGVKSMDPAKADDLRNYLISQTSAGIQAAFGQSNVGGVVQNRVGVSLNGNVMTLAPVSGSVLQIAGTALAPVLGYQSGQTSNVSLTSSIGSVFGNVGGDSKGNINFTINGKNFSFTAASAINDVINAVNAGSAGVTMSYSALDNTFKLTASDTGYSDAGSSKINISEGGSGDTSGLLKAMFGSPDGSAIGGVASYGTDAVLSVNGSTIYRASNSFSINGVNLTLTGVTNQAIDVTPQVNADATVNVIKGFVDAYNTLVTDLKGTLSEKYDKTYAPLTDAQKSSMSDTDVANWEAAGKKGLLNNDPTITSMLSNLRSALMQNVTYTAEDGTQKTISLSSIGIAPPSFMDDPQGALDGKLVIDETKLRAAIGNDPDAVAKLFTQNSDVSAASITDAINSQSPNVSAMRTQRFNTSGLGSRFADIFKANVNTTYLSEGALIKIAGTGGKSILTDMNSSIYQQISNYDSRISLLQQRMYAQEDSLNKKFANLETALSQLSAQASYFNNSSSG